MIYPKGDFKGLLFAEFSDPEARDTAVALLRSAGLKPGGKSMWASQDRSPIDRAARNFCFGLKHLFKNKWEIPYIVKVSDEAPYTVTVGGELAVTVSPTPTAVVYERHGDWATWSELHASPDVQELLQKSNDLVARATKGMKGAAALRGTKGSAKGQAQ